MGKKPAKVMSHWKGNNRAGSISISILGIQVETEYFPHYFQKYKAKHCENISQEIEIRPFQPQGVERKFLVTIRKH